MSRRFKKHLRFWVRSFWGVLLFAVITLAVLVQIGRAVFPVLNDYRDFIELSLEQQLGVDVSIGSIDATWEGLRPSLTLLNVALGKDLKAPGGSPKASRDAVRVGIVEMEVSLLATLNDWRLAFRELSFTGLRASVVQLDEGWRIKGLPPSTSSGEGDFVVDDPVDVFLFGRRISLLETNISVELRNGRSIEISIPKIALENDDNFHRFSASFAIDGNRSVQFLVEGRGDPRDESFSAVSYLRLHQFPAEKVLAAFIADDNEHQWTNDGLVDLELWLEGKPKTGMNIRGLLEVSGSPLKPSDTLRFPQSVSTRLAGRWRLGGAWNLSLQDLDMRWPEFTAPLVNLQLQGMQGEDPRVAFSELDIAQWLEVVSRVTNLPEQARKALDELQPFGKLYNGRVTLVGKDRGYFLLQSRIAEGGNNAFQGAPAITGVNGFIEVSAFDGRINLQSDSGFSMFFPRIYYEPMLFEGARGEIRWLIDLENAWVGVSSGRLELQTQYGAAATGHFNLRLPHHSDELYEQEMTLIIAMPQAPAEAYRYFVPFTVDKNLYDWLKRGIKGGDLANIAFLFDGSVMKKPSKPPAILLGMDISSAEVLFDPKWPMLTNTKARLDLDNRYLSVTDIEATMSQLTLHNAKVELKENPVTQSGAAIFVKGQVSGRAEHAFELINDSPISGWIGKEVSSWNLQGDLNGNLDLLIPLDSEAPGADHNIEMNLANAALEIPSAKLKFTKLQGPFAYNSKTGVSSRSLKAELWGEDLQANIRSDANDLSRTYVDIEGAVNMSALKDWTERPELAFFEGSAKLQAQLLVPSGGVKPMEFVARSDLVGVNMRLPEPLGKSAEQAQQLIVDIDFAGRDSGEPSEYYFDFDNRAQVRLLAGNNQLKGLTMAFGEPVMAVEEGVINLQGRISSTRVEAWEALQREYLASLNEATPTTKNVEEKNAGENKFNNKRLETQIPEVEPLEHNLPTRFALNIDRLFYGESEIPKVTLVGESTDEAWLIEFDYPLASGSASVFNDQRPTEITLDVLRIGDDDNSEKAQLKGDELPPSLLGNIDISAIKALNVDIKKIVSGENDYGHWKFNVRPIEGGLIAKDLYGSLRGLNLSGAAEPILSGTRLSGTRSSAASESPKRGAELVWLRSAVGDQTFFNAAVEAQDLGPVLESWGQEQALSSKAAAFSLDVQWRGAPDQLMLKNIFGVMTLDIERGKFNRSSSVSQNPILKLIGLLNFDTLARRLRLDFSDLNTDSMAFERVKGMLQFNRGIIDIQNPLQVDTPSTQIQFKGAINIESQTLDAQLVATLPVTGNLTVAAALAGGLPTAVGVYVVGKLFKQQVDKVSSIRYRVKGTWDEPEVSVERIFENKTDIGDTQNGESKSSTQTETQAQAE